MASGALYHTAGSAIGSTLRMDWLQSLLEQLHCSSRVPFPSARPFIKFPLPQVEGESNDPGNSAGDDGMG